MYIYINIYCQTKLFVFFVFCNIVATHTLVSHSHNLSQLLLLDHCH